jgi:hypothetical protein
MSISTIIVVTVLFAVVTRDWEWVRAGFGFLCGVLLCRLLWWRWPHDHRMRLLAILPITACVALYTHDLSTVWYGLLAILFLWGHWHVFGDT